MFWLELLLVGPLAQANPGEIIDQGAQASLAIAESLDGLWESVLSGGLYAAIAQVGVFFAVGTLLLFITQWTKDLIDGDNPRAFSELIWPILVIALLANNASLLASVSKGVREIINTTNQNVLEYTSASVKLSEAYQQAQGITGVESAIKELIDQCQSLTDPAQQKACLERNAQKAQDLVNSLPNAPTRLQKAVQNLLGQVENLTPENLDDVFWAGVGGLTGSVLQTSLRGWLIFLSIAFQWVIEISLLLTALLGPMAVGGSLLPVGGKAIYAWLTGLFSIGMVKLCFNIIAGLAATLVLEAEDSDPMIFAFLVGIFAPILALVLATGGGMAVFNSLSRAATFLIGLK